MDDIKAAQSPAVDEMLKAVAPGERRHFHLEVAISPSGTPIFVPVIAVRGKSEGPTLGIISGVHGNEGPSSLAVTRFCKSIDPELLSGMILAVPIANTPAFENQTRTNTWDKGDLVRLWPGQQDGTITERTAYIIFKQIVSRLDYLVDVHCGTHVLNEFWTLYANPLSPIDTITEDVADRSRKMAIAFGMDQILRRHPWYTTVAAGGAAGVPTIVAEVGGGPDFYNRADYYYQVMDTGMRNVAKCLQMLPGGLEHEFSEVAEYDIEEDVIAQEEVGHWHRTASPGDEIRPGDAVGDFVDPFTGQSIKQAKATTAGTVLNPHVSWSQISPGQFLLAIGSLVERHRAK